MPKKIIALVLSLLALLTAFVIPSFAAEGDIDTDEFVYSPYPSANLIPFPYYGFTASSAPHRYFSLDGYAVKIETDGLETVQRVAYIAYGLSLPAGTYTFSNEILAGENVSGAYLELSVVDGGVRKYYSVSTAKPLTLTVENDGATMYLYYVVRANSPAGTVTMRPMMNVGEVAYPFTPYLPYLLQQQYDKGYAEGEVANNQAAYDKGYTEGSAAGILQGTNEGYKAGYQAGIDASLLPLNLFNIPFSLSYKGTVYGARISQITETVEYNTDPGPLSIPTTKDGFTFSISSWVDFLKNDAFNYITTPIRFGGAGDGFYLDFVNDSSVSSRFTFMSSENLFTVVSSVYNTSTTAVSGFNISAFVCLAYDQNGDEVSFSLTPSAPVSVGDGLVRYDYSYTGDLDLSTLSVYQMQILSKGDFNDIAMYNISITSNALVKAPAYTAGYNQGYFDGAENGLGQQKDLYFDQGYQLGFTNGKQEGLSIAENGDWRSLMISVVEAPINTFQSLFNFEILGLDMRAAFGSILALSIVLIVIKKVIF